MAANPEVRIAADSGACFGVERALRLVLEASEGDLPVRTLGALIHNPRVVTELEEKGVKPVSSPDEAEGCILVLRTHGASPDEVADAERACSEVIDAVCPFVKKVHRAVKRMEADGRTVVIAGEKGHPEVEATRAQIEDAYVIASPEEARELDLSGRVGLVSQTTLNAELFEGIAAALDEGAEDLLVENTICDATSKHQRGAAELAGQSDVMIVLGGKNSANTRHLADICREVCPRTHHIESEDELELEWFDQASIIGITAGASTPASQIEALRARLEELLG